MSKIKVVLGLFLLSQTALADNDINTQFIRAASSGNLAEVRALLVQGAQINSKDVIGDTALHWSSLECRLNVVEFLVSQPDIQINLHDVSGDVPLGLSASSGCLEVTKYLTRQNLINLNAVNNIGQTPLLLASSMGRTEVAKFLAGQARVDVNAADVSNITPLWIAAANGADGYLEIVKDLVLNHAKLEVAGGYLKSTALNEASATGHLEVVKFLVSAGANRDARDSAGSTPTQTVCSRWAGLPSDDGGGPCPKKEFLTRSEAKSRMAPFVGRRL